MRILSNNIVRPLMALIGVSLNRMPTQIEDLKLNIESKRKDMYVKMFVKTCQSNVLNVKRNTTRMRSFSEIVVYITNHRLT